VSAEYERRAATGRQAPRDEIVLYVHGLWLTGWEAALLRRRLARSFGYDVRVFAYPTVTCSMTETIERLRAQVQTLEAPVLHWVGHSLGGLVIYRFLERCAAPPGRVVFLGTPCRGSRAAASAAHIHWIRSLLGRCVAEELLTDRERRWQHERALGIIAGTRAMGLGRLFARFAEDSDGTVAVSETRMPGASAHRAMPVSHMGMLASAQVAWATGRFLSTGRFD
jgi:pimeloyl-ACP methyl ester carboxylesterase